MSFEALRWAFERASIANKADHLVLLVMCWHANEDGFAWPSVPTIAREARLGQRSVYYSLRRLVAAGVLVVAEQKPGRSTRYRVHLTPANGAGVQAVQGAAGAPTPAIHDTKPLQPVHPNYKGNRPPKGQNARKRAGSTSRQLTRREQVIANANLYEQFYDNGEAA